MKTEGESPAKRTYCFVSLQTSGREPLFAEHQEFKQVVENAWAVAFLEHADVESSEYNLNSVSLYAMVPVEREPSEAVEYLGSILENIREVTQAAWEVYVTQHEIQRAPMLWGESYELRVIENERELSSLRDFIVQKMLGGKELSDLGLEELDEEDPDE